MIDTHLARSRRALVRLAVAFGLLSWTTVLAQNVPAPVIPAAATKIVVATKDSPPFAFRDAGGKWVGISIDLLRDVATRLGLEVELVVAGTPEELLDGVVEGRFGAAIAAISVTAERDARVDFSHPYYSTGLGVAVRAESGTGVARIVRGIFSWSFVTLIGSVVLALLAVGYLFWFFEKDKNQQFSGGHRNGVSNGMWWSTIMLFGHKGVFPTSVPGRILAATSMLLSILLLSVLTGAIASELTVGHFESLIRDHHDLRHVRTLAVDGTSAAQFLRREQVSYESVPTVRAGLEQLAGGRGDALVHDAPLLEYDVNNRYDGKLLVLPQTFELQDYAIAVQKGSALRKRFNGALLELRASPKWQEIRFRYLNR